MVGLNEFSKRAYEIENLVSDSESTSTHGIFYEDRPCAGHIASLGKHSGIGIIATISAYKLLSGHTYIV